MIINIVMKTPDALEKSIKETVESSAEEHGLMGEEKEIFIEDEIKNCQKICEKWFKYEEIIYLEIDTKNETIKVKEIN